MINKPILLALSLIALTGTVVTAQTVCHPGSLNRGTLATTTEPSYIRAMSLALEEFAKTPGNLDMNATAGRLSIAVDEKQIFDIQPSSYKVGVEVRTSYSGVANSTGLKVRKSNFIFATNSTCTDLNLVEQNNEPALSIGTADAEMTLAAQIAFHEYIVAPNAIPQNRHSGGHRVLIHTPQICPIDTNASVNVVRSQHVNSIVYRTSTYLTDLANSRVAKSETHAGRWLPSLCP